MNMHSNVNISAIDSALIAAKARKAMRDSLKDSSTADDVVKVTKKRSSDQSVKAADDAQKRVQKDLQKAEREAARQVREVDRAAARVQREALKASAKVGKAPSHMKKVERALSKLPVINADVQLILSEAIGSLSAQQLDALAQHISHHNRAAATMTAMKSVVLRIGDTVRITAGEPKFIGMTGIVVKSRQLRAKIQVPGIEKLVYIFTGQAELVSSQIAEAV